MKIKRIELQDFRQFFGQQTLVLSTDKTRNVTLVHAENTVGKTTLLNSVLWAFFEMTTKKFENAHDIVCHEAGAEGRNSAKVTVDFVDEHTEYTISRTLTRDSGSSPARLSAHEITNGDHRRIEAGQTLINAIIPKPMAKYFFFDGEAAETFSAEGNRQEVRKALRDILGCSFVDIAKNDLKEIKKQLNTEVQDTADDAEIEKIEREIARLTLEIEQREAFISTHLEQVDAVNNQIAEIDSFLKEATASAALQKERKDFENTRAQALQNLGIAKARVADWLAEQGLSVVAHKIATEATEFLEKEDVKGVIPSPYNEEFVKEILDAKICICSRPLVAGSSEYASVLELLRTAANAEMRSRIQRIRAVAAQIIRSAKKAPRELRTALSDRDRTLIQIGSIESKLGDLSAALAQVDMAEIQSKEGRRRELLRGLQELNQQIAKSQVKKEQDEGDLRRLEVKQSSMLGENARLKPLRQRLDLVGQAIEELTKASEQHEATARVQIMRMVNDILSTTSRNNYRASLEQNFSLIMKTPQGREIGKSGGENQLISLAFIAALIRFCASRSSGSNDRLTSALLIPGTVAPLMLDAPFGQLDTTYREATIKFLPKMAEQLVLFVTSSQGGDIVRELLKERIGAEYILIRDNRKSVTEEDPSSRPADEIVIDGKSYRRAFYNQPRDQTRIQKIQDVGAVS